MNSGRRIIPTQVFYSYLLLLMDCFQNKPFYNHCFIIVQNLNNQSYIIVFAHSIFIFHKNDTLNVVRRIAKSFLLKRF